MIQGSREQSKDEGINSEGHTEVTQGQVKQDASKGKNNKYGKLPLQNLDKASLGFPPVLVRVPQRNNW